MAVCWDTTDDGDINVVNGNPVLISGQQELIRALDARLHTSKGAFSNLPEIGMDTDFMLDGNFRDEELIDAIEDCLKQDERVIAVNEVKVIRNNDVANVEINLDTTLGQLDLKEVNLNANN